MITDVFHSSGVMKLTGYSLNDAFTSCDHFASS